MKSEYNTEVILTLIYIANLGLFFNQGYHILIIIQYSILNNQCSIECISKLIIVFIEIDHCLFNIEYFLK